MTSETPLPDTMKSWVVVQNGSPASALRLETGLPLPILRRPGDLLIKVSHAALNNADLHLMSRVPSFLPFRRRPVPGLDFAGTIVRAGSGVSSYQNLSVPGTEVCGAIPVSWIFIGGTGTLSEYIIVPAHCVVPKPDGLTLAQAAGLGIAGQTAVLIVRVAIRNGMKAGDRVLVNGASGGVGNFLCQILNAKGVVVHAVCSGANEALVRQLGAREVTDYKTYDPVHTHLSEAYGASPFNFIVDCVGSDELYAHSPGYLDPSGLFISIVGGPTEGVVPWIKGNLWPTFLGGTPRRYKILALFPTGEYQNEVSRWVKEGLVAEVPIDSEFSMGDAVQAYERVASKRARGKVILRVTA